MKTTLRIVFLVGLPLWALGAEKKVPAPVALSPMVVSSARYRDYGLSLKMNGTAVFGKKITTLEVGKKVAPGSPADRAGLKSGDKLVSVNGRKRDVLTIKDIDSTLFDRKIGDQVELVVEEKNSGTIRTVKLIAE